MAQKDDGSNTLQLHGYIPGLDILRGAAVGSVVLFHAFYNGGYVGLRSSIPTFIVKISDLGKQGVYLFFVLSGFLITSILLKQRERPDYYKNFYIRRALRILPAYLLLLAFLKGFGVVHWHFVLACVLFVNNMGKLVHSRTAEYGALWTLAVEEQFYLLWPTFVKRLRTGSNLIVVLLIGCALAPVCRIVLEARGESTYTLAPTNMDTLLVGALCALLVQRGTIHARNIAPIYRALAIVGAVFLVPYIYIECFSPLKGKWAVVIWDAFERYELMSFFVAGLLLAVHNAQKQAPARSSFFFRFLVFLGYISYGLYLVHPLIFDAYDHLTRGGTLGESRTRFSILIVRFVVVSLISVLIASLSRRYYEQLFLRRKKQLAPYKGQSPATESLS